LWTGRFVAAQRREQNKESMNSFLQGLLSNRNAKPCPKLIKEHIVPVVIHIVASIRGSADVADDLPMLWTKKGQKHVTAFVAQCSLTEILF